MKVAEPTIADVFAEFLAEHDRPTKARPFTEMHSIVQLLERCLDGYAYESLDKEEKSFWEERWEADEEKNSYCRTFGPEKIPEHVGSFLNWFIIRKVMAGPETAKNAGPVVGKLLAWCEQKGYISGSDVEMAKEHAAAAGQDLPRADKLGEYLHKLAQKRVTGRVLEDLDLVDEQVTITKVEPGKIWFSDWDGKDLGPLTVPVAASELAREGWEVSCTHFVRTAKGWHLVEVANVYPR